VCKISPSLKKKPKTIVYTNALPLINLRELTTAINSISQRKQELSTRKRQWN